MSECLYATVCTVDGDGVLIPFGDPHVHQMPNAGWAFNGRAIVQPLEVPWIGGRHHVVAALGYAPYAHEAGVVDLGEHTYPAGSLFCITLTITIAFDDREVIINRPVPALPPPPKALPAPHRRLFGRKR